MKKISLNAVAIAVGALVAGSAFAAVDINANSGQATFASELNYTTTGGTAISSAADLTVTSKLGFGVSGGQNRYVRYDLGNAKFAVAVVAANLTDTTAGANISNVVISSGGNVGDSFVIFQITAAAGGIPASDVIQFAMPNINLVTNAQKATVTYELHETAVSSVNGTNGNAILSQATADLVKIAPGLNFTINTTPTTTADVEQSFKKFLTSGNGAGVAGLGANTALTADLGQITYGVNAVKKATGAAVALTDLVTAATNVTLTGDFSAGAADPNGAYLSTAANCSTNNVNGTVNTAKTSASLPVGTTGNTYEICYQVTGTKTIPVIQYQAALNVTAAAGANTSSVAAANVGNINHNGTELQSPWFSLATGYISRFILTSNYANSATYTTTVLLENGKTCTSGSAATGTVPANGVLEIDATGICSDIVTTGDTSKRAAVIFNIAAPNNTIQGVYNIVNPTSASISVSNLIRPGTN